MDLFAKFKKGYFTYLASVIVPAIINGLSIPFFKRELGPKNYGQFSICFNAILIATYFISGWIIQGVLRHFYLNDDRNHFSKQTVRITIFTQIIFVLPVFLVVFFLYKDLFLAALFFVSISAISLQLVFLALAQSSLESKKTLYSEVIRSIIFISLAFVVIAFFKPYFLYGLILSIIFSYTISMFFLLKTNQQEIFIKQLSKHRNKTILKELLRYGTPLSLWFLISNLSSFIDKIFMAHNFGNEIQGNYQSIFDMIAKSITMIMAPVLTAIFPLLTIAYTNKDMEGIKKIIKKIFTYELSACLIVTAIYWFKGADILLDILKVPHLLLYKTIGFIVILGTFIWQIAMLVHKHFELNFQSLSLLKLISISFFVQIVFYFFFEKKGYILIFPLGYLIFSITYLALVYFLGPAKNKKQSLQHMRQSD